MTSGPELLLEAAMNHANRREGLDKVKSQTLTKLREFKKPKTFARHATSIAVKFIPVPVVGSIVTKLEDIIANQVEKKVHQYREANAKEDYHKLKFGIKNFDLKQLDRYRHKAKHNIDLYNDWGSHAKQKGAPCQVAYRFAYRFYRAINRLEKLQFLADSLKSIVDTILTFANEQRAQLKEKDMLEFFNAALENETEHKKCGSACIEKLAESDKNGLLNSAKANALLAEWKQDEELQDRLGEGYDSKSEDENLIYLDDL